MHAPIMHATIMHAPIKHALLVPILSLLLGLAACAAPSPSASPSPKPDARQDSTGQATPQPVREAAPTPGQDEPPPPGQPVKMPPRSEPMPAQVSAGQSVQVNLGCSTNSDCVVKDVGSCCGKMPACVNRNSPTDPEGVRARCSAENRASVCGFNEISSCQCVRNQCVGEQEPVGGWTIDPAPTPPADR